MIYIKTKSQVTVQSPLSSYVTFAKLAKSLKTPAYINKKILPYLTTKQD